MGSTGDLGEKAMRWSIGWGLLASALALATPVLAQDARMTATAAPAEPSASAFSVAASELCWHCGWRSLARDIENCVEIRRQQTGTAD